MQKIGIFGGTFNPPHVGHVNIVEEFIKTYNLSRTLIIPTYTPPHKASPFLASAKDRIEMCRRTFSPQFCEICDLEISRKGKSYTYDTLCQLHEQYPGAEFYLLIGDDMLTTFHEWKNPQGILELCTVVASTRSNDRTVQDLIDYVIENYPDYYRCDKFSFLRMNPLELSSTDIRGYIKEGKSIKPFVTQETLEYIQKRRLYYA